MRSQRGPRSNSPVKTTVSRSRSTDVATEHADWADRPSQALHGEQAGKDRAARPIPRQLCTQASLLHLQPPDDSVRTTGQRHSRSIASPACRVRTAKQEGCRNGGGTAIFVASTLNQRPLSTVDELVVSRGTAPNLAGAYTFNEGVPLPKGIGWVPDRKLMAGLAMATQASRRRAMWRVQAKLQRNRKCFLVSRSRLLVVAEADAHRPQTIDHQPKTSIPASDRKSRP